MQAVTKDMIRDAYTFETERNCKLYDMFGRIRYYAGCNKDNIMQPVVSQYMNAEGFKPLYPNGKEFAISFSHDIDVLTEFKLFSFHNRIKSLYKKSGISSAHIEKRLYKRVLIKQNDPEKLIDVNNRHGIKSTFYFLALDKQQVDYNYELDFVADLMNNINASGSEVGLHGSHDAYKSEVQVGVEKSRLAEYAGANLEGYRNHYLRFVVPDTWKYLQKNGFKYDSTYGFVDVVGFRNGMSHPFMPYDAESKTYTDVLEIPLIIMDTTLFEYMRLGWDTAFELCKQLIDEVKKTKGAVSILWHNHYLFEKGQAFYEHLIQYCNDNNAWMPTGRELNDWWRKNDYHTQQAAIMQPLLGAS